MRMISLPMSYSAGIVVNRTQPITLMHATRLRFTLLAYLISASVVGSSAWLPLIAFGQTNTYIVTELSTNDLSQVASRLNNLGVVVGRAANDQQGETRVTVWNGASLRARHLGVLAGGDYSSGSDINDAGQIAGVSNTSKAVLPIIWTGPA